MYFITNLPQLTFARTGSSCNSGSEMYGYLVNCNTIPQWHAFAEYKIQLFLKKCNVSLNVF